MDRRVLAFLTVLGSFFVVSAQPSRADQSPYIRKVRSMEEQAKQSGSASDWTMVGNMWLSGAQSDRTGAADLMARRAAACFTRSFNMSSSEQLSHGGIEYDSRLTGLRRAYDLLAKLEPTNAAWPYLLGESEAARGHYLEAAPPLRKAIQLGGSGGQKAQKLMAHVAPFIQQDHQNDVAETGNVLQYMRTMGANTPRIHYAPTPAPKPVFDGTKTWNQGTAASAAWSAGDTEAQGRINAGSASDADRAKYGSGY
jgi:hypothetical protein